MYEQTRKHVAISIKMDGFGMNQDAEPTQACTRVIAHADTTRLNMGHQSPLAHRFNWLWMGWNLPSETTGYQPFSMVAVVMT